jgi:hypothetical protein
MTHVLEGSEKAAFWPDLNSAKNLAQRQSLMRTEPTPNRRNRWRNTILGLVAALCSVSSANLSQPLAMSIKMLRTRMFGARSDI